MILLWLLNQMRFIGFLPPWLWPPLRNKATKRKPKLFMKHLPEISIIIPCRNEEKFIAQCLDSILAADFPKDDMEVLVVDGMSQDKTRDIVKKYSTQYPFIYLLDNPKYITPCALNIGIKNAKADIVIRIDAHAKYDKNYFKNCVKNLALHQADNVGG